MLIGPARKPGADPIAHTSPLCVERNALVHAALNLRNLFGQNLCNLRIPGPTACCLLLAQLRGRLLHLPHEAQHVAAQNVLNVLLRVTPL